MTLWSSPHPKESAALTLGQAQGTDVGKIKELSDASSALPSSATSFASDGSEDAGFEEGSLDVDLGEEETDGLQIDCIQTLTEFDPITDAELRGNDGSPLMSDCKTAIPLPPPPMNLGSAYGGNQAYASIQNSLPRIMERTASPIQSYWGTGTSSDTTFLSSRMPGDVGLNNIGNTCFMNSGLQCLVHTSPLVEFFVRSESFERTSTSLVYQFNSLMNHVWFGLQGSIALHDFKLVLGNKYGQFKDCRQHDCQEFLAVLLDMLHEELKSREMPILSSVTVSSEAESYIEDCTESENNTCPDKLDAIDIRQNEANSMLDGSPTPKRLRLETLIPEESSGTFERNENVHIEETDKMFPMPESSENQANGIQNDSESLNSCPVRKAQAYWNKYMEENNTVIASTFQGMFKSAVTCSECSFISETFEPFMYLSLPIPRVMEKQISVTFINMKERVPSRVEVTLHLMGTAATLIQEVLKKVGCNVSNAGDCVAAEVFNHRIARVLDGKTQFRNISTTSRNIYVYELNENFGGNENTLPPTLEHENATKLTGCDGQRRKHSTVKSEWNTNELIEQHQSETSSVTPYGPVGAPVGGGFYEFSSPSFNQGGTSSSDGRFMAQNDNFNKIQCNICLEDFSRSGVRKHNGCSCVLCEECIKKSAEHFDGGQSQETHLIKCAVCLKVVDSKTTFTSLEESSTSSSPDIITIPIIFRNEPGTDANNNDSWSPGLFGFPWLIRVPSFVDAAELIDYVESINPAPSVTHRLLSVKSDGKNCGQCLYSTRCNGCELPKEGMISLNSCNSILISYADMSSDQVEQMQPSDMILHNELSSAWQYNRNEEPTIDIHDCLRTFSETEHLDEQNPWFCPRCEKNQRATKALSICKFPDYLIVYLKRFVFLDQSSNKLNNRLTFPIHDLDVSDYVTEGFGENVGKYNLYSCVCHFGSASAGHYTAYAKNPLSNKWHYFNDDTIEERSPADNEYASAYVLFYEKQGMSCHIPSKPCKPLPDLNCFNTTSALNGPTDTRGSYLPDEPSVPLGPLRPSSEFTNDTNIQVDSTSSNFSYPHTSTEPDLIRLEEGDSNENENNRMAEIRDGLGLSETDISMVTSSTSEEEHEHVVKADDLDFNNMDTGENDISTTTQHSQFSVSSGGDADSTSN